MTGALLVGTFRIQTSQEIASLHVGEVNEMRRSHRHGLHIQGVGSGEEGFLLVIAHPLGQYQIDELRDFDTRRAWCIRLRYDHLRDLRYQPLLSWIECAEWHIAEPAMDLFAELDRSLCTPRQKLESESSAEKLNSFTSSH